MNWHRRHNEERSQQIDEMALNIRAHLGAVGPSMASEIIEAFDGNKDSSTELLIYRGLVHAQAMRIVGRIEGAAPEADTSTFAPGVHFRYLMQLECLRAAGEPVVGLYYAKQEPGEGSEVLSPDPHGQDMQADSVPQFDVVNPVIISK